MICECFLNKGFFHLVISIRKQAGHEFLHVSDVSTNLEIFGSLNPARANFLQLFLRNLDDANQWLAINVLVIVDDHVKTIVDGTHSLGHQSLLRGNSLSFKFNVLGSRDLPLLLNFLPILLEGNLVRVGVGFVAALLFNAGLDHAALTALVVDECLDNFRLFKVLILSELDREPGSDSRSDFFQEELFIKAVAGLAT